MRKKCQGCDISYDGCKKACTFDTHKMQKYRSRKGDNQKWVTISRIEVPTEYDKQELLRAFHYLHDLRDIDTDYLAVNAVVHTYSNPNLIKVTGKE